MKSKPSIDAFLDGSTADAVEKPSKGQHKSFEPIVPVVPVKVYREQKVFRLSTDVIQALRDKAYELTKQEGRRITETEIVEQAIKNYLDS